ncbi:MAG: hypothetical protein ACR2JD_06455 [Nocardioides sp.]
MWRPWTPDGAGSDPHAVVGCGFGLGTREVLLLLPLVSSVSAILFLLFHVGVVPDVPTRVVRWIERTR